MKLIPMGVAASLAAMAAVWTGAVPVEAAAGAPTISAADRQFLDDSYSINEGEIQLAQLAEQRGTTQAVMQVAQHMIHDHTRALDASKRVATQVHLRLPMTVNAATKAQYGELSKMSGRAFDDAYLDATVAGHEAAVREFEQEAANGQSSVIKRYARAEVPMLRAHLALAHRARQQEQPGVAEPQKR